MDISIIDNYLNGFSLDAYKLFGAHIEKDGVRFSVYAPHAKSVYLIGDFNNWQNSNMMEKVDDRGVYSIFIRGLSNYDRYKYRIETRSGSYIDKADPFAFFSELRPNNASFVYDISNIYFDDELWMNSRDKSFNKPINIYEIYAGGWKRKDDRPYSLMELKDELISYVKDSGYTHIEFMPLIEHPFDGSWGYQASGYYSLTSRYGNPLEFASFVDECHKNNIGVIIDMVPVHFVKDDHGLRLFDGEPLYEYKNEHDANSEWGTSNFDLSSEMVRSFLMSSFSFWCDIYHVDGIRIDAVANLIYWGGNKNRGTNFESINFIKRLNYHLSDKYKGLLLIAEDSSDFPKVTESTINGGLGFDYKWDLGWMNDTLKYYSIDPIYRYYHHNKINFSMAYFYSERFILPFSHDEVVHGKLSIVDKMFGTYEQKFAQCKNLFVYMYAHPGKKLNFMGNEIASFREFDECKQIDWFILNYPIHDSFNKFIKDLNKIYLNNPSLYLYDYTYDGFKWIDADNAKDSIYTFYRTDNENIIVCILNMCDKSYDNFEVKVPYGGAYKEIMNSEYEIYSGNGFVNEKSIKAKKIKGKNEYVIDVKIASFAGILLKTKVKNRD